MLLARSVDSCGLMAWTLTRMEFGASTSRWTMRRNFTYALSNESSAPFWDHFVRRSNCRMTGSNTSWLKMVWRWLSSKFEAFVESALGPPTTGWRGLSVWTSMVADAR